MQLTLLTLLTRRPSSGRAIVWSSDAWISDSLC
jgi:hypothetical protein